MAIRGNSGSGKSTLLNLLGGLDQATAGHVMVDGVDMNSLTRRDLNDYRKHTVGFVWQNPARNLVPYLTALQNVELAMMTAGKVDKRFARELLERMELKAQLHAAPAQMSGGQQQRVAVAVALANRPRILLADEPTGALDTKTAGSLLTLLRSLRDELQLTILIVTHDPRIAGSVERTVAIRDGRVAQESLRAEEREIPLEEALAQARREYVLMDARGRLQLPAEVLEEAHLHGSGRLTAHAENGQIILSSEQGDE
jgi:ABC-type lipoprotein export system ATPase subunit